MEYIYASLRDQLLKGKISIDKLKNFKPSFENDLKDLYILQSNDEEFKAYLMLLLDYYTYNDNGDVLISDSDYDIAMQNWCQKGNSVLIYPDVLSNLTTWPFIKHTEPGMVGSVKKVYTKEDLERYLKTLNGIKYLILAPKYDGISASITVKSGSIVRAVTRADGVEGQDIIEVVKRAYNSKFFNVDLNGHLVDGVYKCELAVSQDNFENILDEKEYKNRRSATTGIINSPKNLFLAKYVSIIPLLFKDENGNIKYIPPIQETLEDPTDINHIMKKIIKMLDKIRDVEFPFRVDGVVLFPMGYNVKYNDNDYMDKSIAFKINTAKGITSIKYGYVSVGRKGFAIPMLKVKAVEVNETTVEDVSLGSFDKFMNMNLHEHEKVIVFSAGDVIPQIEIPKNRIYDEGANYIDIKKKCPHCNQKLERFGGEYRCTNSDCPRIVTGFIATFLENLGAESFSDATVYALYDAKLLRNIQDLFSLKYEDICKLPGFHEKSSMNIINEINKIKDTPVSVSKLFGALSIPDIAEKKCRKIFKEISVDKILDMSKDNIIHRLLNAEGIGTKTAETFADFVKDNKSLIRFLISNISLLKDKKYKGNVVFTGFRNPDLETRFNNLGYEVSDSINSNTLALISASSDRSSGKCKSAIKKNIDVVSLSNVDEVLEIFGKN